MTPTQITLAAVTVVLAVVGLRYRRSPLPIAKQVTDPFVELIRWALLLPTAIALIGELAAPQRLAWAHLPVPGGVRLAGGAVACVATALIAWAFAALGANFAATLLVREGHGLVTHGPYRFVRHPMYALGFALLLGLGVMTCNGVVLIAGPAAMAVVMAARVPKEERMLAERFGDTWSAYAARTGRFLPRL